MIKKLKNHQRLISEMIILGLFLIAATFLFVPFSPAMPGEILDSSWQLGMNQAVAQGLVLGRELIFTFGPYASIYTKVFHPGTYELMIYGSLYIAIAFGIIFFTNFKNINIITKYLIIIGLVEFSIISILFNFFTDGLIYFFVLLVGLFTFNLINNFKNQNKAVNIALAIFLFGTFGLLPLIKGSFLVATAGISAISILSLISNKLYKASLIILLTIISTTIIFWIASGQLLSSLPQYLSSLVPIIGGYTEAMSRSSRFELLEGVYFLALSVLISVVYFLNNKISLKSFLEYLMIFFILFLALKAGFIRNDPWHLMATATTYYLTISLLLSRYYIDIYKFFIYISVTFFTILLFSLCYIQEKNIVSAKDLILKYNSEYEENLEKFNLNFMDKKVLIDRFNVKMSNINEKYQFPRLVGTTDIYSFDQSYLIASGNFWSPRPIFQSYSAYTPSLIEINKQHLYGSDAPDNIILKIQTIDDRFPSLDDGGSWPVIFSRYYPYKMVNDYLILKNNKNNASPDFELALSKKAYNFGELVKLPDGDHLIFAKIKIHQTFFGKIINILFKPSELNITINTNDGDSLNFRLIPGMAISGFVISPLIESAKDFNNAYTSISLLKNKGVKSFFIKPNNYNFLWNKVYEVELFKVNPPKHSVQQ
jgi:hypothetical protein